MNTADGQENPTLRLLFFYFKWWGKSSWDGAPEEILNTELQANVVFGKVRHRPERCNCLFSGEG